METIALQIGREASESPINFSFRLPIDDWRARCHLMSLRRYNAFDMVGLIEHHI